VSPFHYLDSGGSFCFDQVTNQTDLLMLGEKINNEFNNSYSQFNPTKAYVITWSYYINSVSTMYQVVLCMDNKTSNSFMIVSYAELDIQSDTNPSFYSDSLNHKNTFTASINGSNCNTPGQYVFQLNKLNGEYLFLFLICIKILNIISYYNPFYLKVKSSWIQPCLNSSAPPSNVNAEYLLNFIFYNKTVNKINIHTDGDFYLSSSQSYRIAPYHYYNSNGFFCFDKVSNASEKFLNNEIYMAYSNSFQAASAYAITWSIQVNSQSVFYQVVLCTDSQSSFMIVSYAELNSTPDNDCCLFVDTASQEHTFHPSITNSNMKIPGQLIFQFNTFYQQLCKFLVRFTLFYLFKLLKVALIQINLFFNLKSIAAMVNLTGKYY
jgi:hypothetical protein